MKKKSLIVSIILVMALAFSGIAYAAWTDHLFINGTAETGDLDVNFDTDNSLGYGGYPWISGSTGVEYSAQYIDDNTCQVTISQLYPGAEVSLWADMENNGTIPAAFDNAVLNFSGDTELIPYLKAQSSYYAYKDAAHTDYIGGTIQGWAPLSALDDNMTTVLHNLTLQPGGYLSLDPAPGLAQHDCIVIKMDENAPNDMENKSISFTLQMNWKQFNK